MDVRVDYTRRDYPAFGGNCFCTSADNNINIGLHIRITRLGDMRFLM